MRLTLMLAVFSVCVQCFGADDFRPDDSVIILVSGASELSKPWGLSGEASMYRGTSTQSSGKIGFSEVDGSIGVSCERRSAKKVTSVFDYSTSGQIPPGIYFVSYHRLDPNGSRHRLAIGDSKSGTTIAINIDNKEVVRTDIQFHEAANNLIAYSPRLSEGCIILSDVNFSKLFPLAFLAPATSPLAPSIAKTPSAKEFKGNGNVLVFVTDVSNSQQNQRQLNLFEAIRKGEDAGLGSGSFASNSADLIRLRLLWSE